MVFANADESMICIIFAHGEKRFGRLLLALALMFVTSICACTSAIAASRVEAQLAQLVSDKDVLDYLVKEAKRARVSRIKLLSNAAISRKCRSQNAYGCSTYSTGSRRGDIFLNAEIRGGTGLTNITHEIAHIAAFRRNCFAHGDLWLEYLMGMAQRFEARFPGKRWGRSSPTGSVRAKYTRYASQRSRC